MKKFVQLMMATMVMGGLVIGGAAQTAEATQWVARTPEQIKQDIGNSNEYVIQWGDTLSAISEAIGKDMVVLQQLNNIQDANVLITGNRLVFTNDGMTVFNQAGVVVATEKAGTVNYIPEINNTVAQGSVNPETPSTPAPEQPVNPETPSTPAPEQPVNPETPSTPEPEQPVDPGTPSTPAPEQPVDPGTPGTPEPEQPVDPGTPSTPEPEQPVDPGSPSEPEEEKPYPVSPLGNTGELYPTEEAVIAVYAPLLANGTIGGYRPILVEMSDGSIQYSCNTWD